MDSKFCARWATLALLGFVAFSPAYGEDSTVPLSAHQQQLARECNAQAVRQGLQFEKRKHFVNQCMNGENTGIASAQGQAQQQLVKDCNARATQQGLKFEQRKQFVANCTSGSAQTQNGALQTSQLRMNYCNERATHLHLTGDARQNFMTNCLKG